LNCQPYDVPVLVAARLLKPLDNPQPNSVKYFASGKCWIWQKTVRGWREWQMHWTYIGRRKTQQRRDPQACAV